jgi:hypothetical protein
MNWAQIHLAFNHVPVILVPTAGVLLVLAAMRRNVELNRISLVLVVVAAASAIGVFLTGEPAEAVVEHLAGVTEETIHAHEESAEASLVATGLAGLLAFGALAYDWTRGRMPAALLAVTVIAVLVAAGLLARTANLGGAIRHPEITAPAARVYVPALRRASPIMLRTFDAFG